MIKATETLVADDQSKEVEIKRIFKVFAEEDKRRSVSLKKSITNVNKM